MIQSTLSWAVVSLVDWVSQNLIQNPYPYSGLAIILSDYFWPPILLILAIGKACVLSNIVDLKNIHLCHLEVHKSQLLDTLHIAAL